MLLTAITTIISSEDRAFLDRLYRTYYSMLYALANSILHDDMLAGDAVMDGMMAIFSKVSLLRSMGERELAGYLRRTVRRAAFKLYKAQNRRFLTDFSLEKDALFSVPSQNSDPNEILIKKEDFHMVREAILSLPEQDRRLLYLKYAAGLNAKEIMELTRAPSTAAVHERLSRARRKALARLKERGWPDEAGSERQGTSGGIGG